MKKIILDTDFLIDCIKFRIDFIDEISRILDFNYKICIIDKTLDELRNKASYKLIKGILEANSVEIIDTEKDKNVDDLILDLVNENYIIATQDQELKRKLKIEKIQIITIRQKSHLVLT